MESSSKDSGLDISVVVPFKAAHLGAFLLALLIVCITSGCSAIKMGGTRSLPPTTLPENVALSGRIKQITLDVTPFDVSTATVYGGHYEGLLQVRQPLIWGVSDEQKNALYGDLLNVARYAFIDEMMRRGITVRVPGEQGSPVNIPQEQEVKSSGDIPLAIKGGITSIELNTYGHGLSGSFEGVGSAGNYWEAEVSFSGITVTDPHGTVIWKGDIVKYCKLANSPVKLDWTAFTLISKSLKMVGSGGSILKAGEAVSASGAEYRLEATSSNPVEISSRLAALYLLQIIEGKLR